MDRQKPRANLSVDGFSRPGFYLDGVSRPVRQLPKYEERPRPVLQPRANQDPNFTVQAPLRSIDQMLHRPENETIAAGETQKTSELPDINRQNGPSLLGSNLTPNAFSRPHHLPKRKSKFKRILKPAAISAAVIIVGFGIWFGSNIIGNIDKVFHGNVFSDAHALFSGSSLKESNGRINILLAGNSVDDPHHQGAALTDSIMVISYDPSTKSGFMLSIPRDLWVDIPTMGHQKINAAYLNKNFSSPGYPSGGMGQLEQIVQNDLGIPIDYEALIDYTAFRDAVNTVGGITVNISSPDPRGIYDPYTHLKLPNGNITLSGQQALDLARTRGDGPGSYGIPESDFTRTMYQREMLKALFKKALTVGVLSNPIKVASLFNSFGSNVQTDLSLGDVTSLLRVTGGLNLSQLHSVSYSYGGQNPLLKGYVAPDGEDALIPTAGLDNFSQLRSYFQQLTSSNPVKREAPTVTLLNGSDVSGLASREEKLLDAQGFDVVSIADASRTYRSTMIIDNSSGNKPASSMQLQKDIHGQVVTSSSGSQEANEASNYSSNFVVVMGQDWDQTTATGNPVQN